MNFDFSFINDNIKYHIYKLLIILKNKNRLHVK